MPNHNQVIDLGGGGGGGGGGGVVISGTAAFNTNANITGGNGGNGGIAQIIDDANRGAAGTFTGGDGGFGGVGLTMAPGEQFTAAPATTEGTVIISGGNGGSGGATTFANRYGSGAIGYGGNGGGGAVGIIANGPASSTDPTIPAISLAGGVTVNGGNGGNGGAGGQGYGTGGIGGAGANAVTLLGGASLSNLGEITAGSGGDGGNAVVESGPDGNITGNFTGGTGGGGGIGMSLDQGGRVFIGPTDPAATTFGTVNGGRGGAGGNANVSNAYGTLAYGVGGTGGNAGDGIVALGPASVANPFLPAVVVSANSDVYGGLGGAGGFGSGIVDTNQPDGAGAGGAGGMGGNGITLENGASASVLGSVSAGRGGDGGVVQITINNDAGGTFTAGNGGAGGTGISLAAGGQLAIGSADGTTPGFVTGGNGGNGGRVNSPNSGSGVEFTAVAGNGANGGDGIVSAGPASTTDPSIITVTINSGSFVRGGGGGAGGDSGYGIRTGGTGGNGGLGVRLLNGGILSNAGDITGSNGGAGGPTFEAFNTDEAPGAGGNGGSGIQLIAGGTVLNNGSVQGGSGGNGGTGDASDGVAGAAGSGIEADAGGSISNFSSGLITGGMGGIGNILVAGGAGISGSGLSIDNYGRIIGGVGGPSFSPGQGGDGVDASGSTITNETGGIIGGGDAAEQNSDRRAAFVTLAAAPPANGNGNGTTPGGYGIHGDNLNIINGGTITGGLASDGVTQQPTAILFSGGTNTLTLTAGTDIVGQVQAFIPSTGPADTFVLGGDATPTVIDASTSKGKPPQTTFDVGAIVGIGTAPNADLSPQYVGFKTFVKDGLSTWTLSGTTDYVTPWIIKQGTLAISSDTNLGGEAPNALPTGGVTLDGGTLETTANVTSSRTFSLTANGGAVETDAGTTFEITTTGSIDDNGSGGLLTKSGAGVLMLDGNNTYVGGTHVTGGEIEILTAGGVGSGTVTLDPGTTLGFGNSLTFANAIGFDGDGGATLDTGANTVTLTGGLAGGGGLVKAGSGTLVLPTANSYTGGTAIAAGEIEIGAADSLGTGSLSMDNGTTLGFLGSFTFANAVVLTNVGDPTIDTGANTDTMSGVISGPGALTKIGTGTLFLTGVNTYTGGTTISQGTLVGSAKSFGSGGIVDNAALVFDQPTNASFANPISGPGTVTKIGAGVLDLTDASTYTGATTLSQGGLLVDGSVAISVITAESGTVLGGFGTVGGIVAQSGATIAPGLTTPYSTLRVAGNATFQPGSTFRLQVNGPTGTTDAIAATGAATIGGGTVAAVINGPVAAGQAFTILTAAGGRTGTFNALTTTGSFAFLTPELVYDPTRVILTFVANGTTPQQIGATPNQRPTGSGLPSSVLGSMQSFNVPTAQRALDQLSGEGHASVETAAVQAAEIVSTAVLDRLWNIGGASGDAYDVLRGLGSPLPTLLRCYAPGDTTTHEILSHYSVWAVGLGDFGHFGSNGNAASLDTSLGGFIGGVDMPIYAGSAIWKIGVAGGYANDDIRVSDRSTNGTFQSAFGTLYGGLRLGAFDARFGAGAAANSTDLQRTVAFPGFSQSVHSSYGGSTVQGFGEIGYRFSFGQKVVEPVAGFTAVSVHQDSFREDGGLAALRGRGQDTTVETSELGFRAEATPFDGLPLVARLHLAWQHSFGDLDPRAVLAFEAGGSAFQVTGAPIDHDAALIEAGADYRATGALTIGLNYVGTIGSRDQDNSIRGKVEYRF